MSRPGETSRAQNRDPDSPQRIAVAFVRVLRGAGLRVPTGSTVVYAGALAAVGLDRPDSVYWAGRATLVRRPEDITAYDQAFAAFFGDAARRAAADAGHLLALPPPPPMEVEVDIAVLRWSPDEALRDKDLAACTPDELDEAHRLIAALRTRAPLRRHRRRRPDPHGRGRPDLRGTVRRALRNGGEVFRPATTRAGERPRRLVLLLDVSGSMEAYARSLARFAHAAAVARRHGQVEVFALGTRVTRITRQLASRDPDEALAAAAVAVVDWSGGTRLGDGIARFNDRWGVRGMARGATVVILSDGWDRGDPARLGAEMARLRRVAHRLVWVNPLKATPGFAPLAQGMAAALPHVDELVEGHSVAALESLVEVVAR
jgi:uncharacterized protein with von Willebrand factor type A (vWA) domain